MTTSLQNKVAFLLATIMILPLFSFAQEVTEEWVARYNNDEFNGNDLAHAIAIDDAGNTYVTGESAGNGTAQDYFTIKYDSNGDLVWGERYNGDENNNDMPSAMVVDDAQNVYVTGKSVGTNYDYYTIKYDANGESLWEKRYNNEEANVEDEASAIVVDGSGNVYVTGRSVGNGTQWDFYTIAYDPNGTILWTDRYNGTGNFFDEANAIALDTSGNIYVTGRSVGVGTGYDIFTIKYDSSGDILWTERFDGIANSDDMPNAIAVDESGNVYITGQSGGVGTGYDFVTIKYDTDGNELWTKRYSGPNPGSTNVEDVAKSIAVDASGNVFVAGFSVQASTYNYATLKYDQNGNTMWASTYNGPVNSDDLGVALAIDIVGDIYVTGYSVDVGWDIATVKYDSQEGEELWVERHVPGALGGGALNDYPAGIAVDGSGNVYVAGYSDGNGVGVDYVTIKYAQPLFFDCTGLEANIGDPCDDQDETTENDVVDEDCECAGTPIIISVETIDGASELNVFPNPTSGNCTLALGQSYPKTEVRVTNYLGKELQRTTYFNETQIELNLNFPAGIYFIDVITDSRRTMKVIKN